MVGYEIFFRELVWKECRPSEICILLRRDGVAGRTSQEFNQRKNRKRAYWEDRYHGKNGHNFGVVS